MNGGDQALPGLEHGQPRRLRVLFAGYSLADPLGGGELSARALLIALAGQQDVRALCVGRAARTYQLDGGVLCEDFATSLLPPPAGMPFHVAAMRVERQFREKLAPYVAQFVPDVLILQQPAALLPRDIPAATTVAIFMHSLVCYGAGDPNPSAWKRAASRVFRDVRLRRNRALLHRANMIVSNSRYLQQVLRAGAAISSQVVAPFIEVNATGISSNGVAFNRTGDAITFVGLDAWKGARIAIRIAQALPHRQFLFLDGPRASDELKAQARRLPNVTCAGWTDDMRTVFANTRILLMPSVWEEPFGRLPVEAGAYGIPTLASARGGLAESVGDGGALIDPPDDIGQWTRQIVALDDAVHYAACSAAARQHASTFALGATLRQFVDGLERETGVTLLL